MCVKETWTWVVRACTHTLNQHDNLDVPQTVAKVPQTGGNNMEKRN
jgi:hypothetical protein